jgi:hypothetical protein
MASVSIQVTPEDFCNTHSSLVRLLLVVEKAGLKGLATRDLCDISFNNRKKGMEVIREAEQAGYIRRIKVPKITSKLRSDNRGRYYVMNSLTPSGRKLLNKLQLV